MAARDTAADGDLDDAAFRHLYEQHLGDLWRFARRRSGTDHDADDVVAEVFAVAWRRGADLPPGPEVRLWLFGVGRNVIANRQRAARRRERLHLRLADAEVVRNGTAPPADHHLEPGVTALPAALAALSEADRDLLVLRAWDGLAVGEIATLLGCTPNAASVRLHKARRRLADELDRAAEAEGRTDRPADRTCPDRSPQPRGGAR